MESLKILWFNWRCWLNPDMGGAEVFTREVAERWVKRGHEVTLFTSEFSNCKREEILEGVRVVRRGGRFWVYLRAKSFYRSRFRREGFNVVVDEINTRPFFAPKFVRNGEQVVGLIHQLAREYWLYETPFPLSYLGYYFLENRWLRNYADVPMVTVSESTQQELVKLGFNRVYIVPEGLNFEPLRRVPEKVRHPVVVFVGRLRRAKRPDHAIRAFRIVREKFPCSELWVVGDGYFREDLESLAGVGVNFLSGLSDAERRELIQRAWILVNPSVREGFGLNVIEAGALGTPCVAYDVAGLRDAVIDKKTGLLAKAADVDDLSKKMIFVLKNETLRKELSENALALSRRFSWDETAEEFLKVLLCMNND
jgi:glycosyltransferase involved in cell wall biosynthesis